MLSVLCPQVIPVELASSDADGSPVGPEILKFKDLAAPVVVFPAENIKLPEVFWKLFVFNVVIVAVGIFAVAAVISPNVTIFP